MSASPTPARTAVLAPTRLEDFYALAGLVLQGLPVKQTSMTALQVSNYDHYAELASKIITKVSFSVARLHISCCT